MEYFNGLKAEAVLVPAEFITQYMASVNGDYVKVYLWLLYNGSADIEKMADQLMLSEGDIRRAIRYWQDKGVLAGRKSAAKTAEQPAKELPEEEKKPQMRAAAMEVSGNTSLRERYRGTGCTEILNRLSADVEFAELMIIVQRYLSKILNEKETQLFAYLYDGLHLPVDVIDYMVAYAVDHDRAMDGRGNVNAGYFEKLGADWAEIGIRDVKAARRRTKQFEAKTAGIAGGPSGKNAPAENSTKTPRKDYNEMVVQEFLQNMGD